MGLSKSAVHEQFRRFDRGELTLGALELRLASLTEDDDEYVTLDAVLGRGRHEDESGVDLRFPTR